MPNMTDPIIIRITHPLFSSNGDTCSMMLADNGHDLLMTVDSLADGSPDWENAGLADPRGTSEAEWAMILQIIDVLRTMHATVRTLQP